MEVFKRALPSTHTLCNKNTAAHLASVLGPLISNCVKKLDRVVTETAGCDSFIQVLQKDVAEVLISLLPDKALLKEALTKKFRLVSANAWLKLGDYDQASKAIEQCCSMINKGEKDELKVYFLAFKMHCQLRDKEEAIETF